MKGVISMDSTIFEIEDYIGGNIEGQETIDRMALTVFLRRQLESLLGEAHSLLISKLPDTPENKAVLNEMFGVQNG